MLLCFYALSKGINAIHEIIDERKQAHHTYQQSGNMMVSAEIGC